MKKDRDEEWANIKSALAAMTRERDAWRKQLYECAYNRGVAEAKLEAVEAIVAQAITDPYLISHLEAALATIGLSVRQRVEKLLADCQRLYTVALFPEITEEELSKLREIGMLSIIDRNSAAMGRHMAELIEAALTAEESPSPQKG